MSRMHEIDRAEWARFFDEVSRIERDHPVHVEVDDAEIGAQELAQGVPFIGLSCELKDGGGAAIDLAIAPGDGQGAYTHHIENARAVWAEEGDDGALECVDIEGDSKTLIYFQ